MKKILNVLVLVIVFTLGATSMHVYNKINDKKVAQTIVKPDLKTQKLELMYEIAYLEKYIYKKPVSEYGGETYLDKLNLKLKEINTQIASIK